MKKIFFYFKIFVLLFFGFFIVEYFVGFYTTNKNISEKVKLVRKHLENDGYNVRWFMISGSRSHVTNSILRNSSKNSHHLRGNAIDVFVIDIDGDNKFTLKDLEIVKKYNRIVESKYPHLRGGLGTYTSRPLAKRMIHFDTGGYSYEFNK